MDETAVKIGKSQEALDIVYGFQGFPVQDSIHLLRVHFETFCRDNKAKDMLFFVLRTHTFQAG